MNTPVHHTTEDPGPTDSLAASRQAYQTAVDGLIDGHTTRSQETTISIGILAALITIAETMQDMREMLALNQKWK